MFQVTLRAARVNRGLSLKEAAALVNRSDKTIARYENDSTRIPRNLFESLIEIYRIPKEHVYCGRESVFTGFLKGNKKTKKIS